MLELPDLGMLACEGSRLVILQEIEHSGEAMGWEQEVVDLLRAIDNIEDRSCVLAEISSFVAWASITNPSLRSVFADLVIDADRAFSGRKARGLSTQVGMFPTLWDVADAIMSGLRDCQ